MLKHVLSQRSLATVLVAAAAAFLTVTLNDSASRGQEKKEKEKAENKPVKKLELPLPRIRYYATTVDAIQAMAPENSKDRMTDGLNVLAASGWALTAIDAGNGNQSGYYVFQRAR